MGQCLYWLDADPSRYWALAWSALTVAGIISIAPELPWLCGRTQAPTGRMWRWFTGAPLYVLAVGLVFAAFRWPVWFAHALDNPDEAQMVAGAITLRDYPVFWKSVDGTSHGPLTDYLLLLPRLFGLPLDYFSARLMGTLLQLTALLGVWTAARRLLSEPAARLGLLPAVILLGSTTYGDFVQYSSEMLALALLTWAAATGAMALTSAADRQPGRWLFTTGLLLGAIPYAKLQAVPLAAALALVCLVTLGARWWREPLRTTLKTAGWLLGGLLLPTLVTAIFLLVFGLGAQFWQSYVVSNLMYAGEGGFSWPWLAAQWFPFIGSVPGFTAFFWGHLVVFVAFGLPAFLGSGPTRRAMLAGWLLLLAAFFSVAAPGRAFAHYLQFLVPALAFLLAAHYQGIREYLSAPGRPREVRWIPLLVLLAIVAYPQAQARRQEFMGYSGTFTRRNEPWQKEASRFILARAQPGDRLALWGWMPGYIVETGLPQGTRDAMTVRAILPNPMMGFYRDRYLRDFTRNRPAWFLDAVGPGNFCFTDRAATGHEIFPELAAVIATDYALLADLDNTRIYRRKTP